VGNYRPQGNIKEIRMRFSYLFHTTLLCALALPMHVAYARNSSEATIKIGLSGPFTGGSSPMGESMRNGIRLAVEEINNIGGINGKKN